MTTRHFKMIDGNEAAASVAYRLNEVIAIYPITPSSPMGELADAWMSESKPNIWGTVPLVYEMQSEGGAAGAIHGALQTGSLATTFTASQGLLLMIPNMYKIAGELTPTVFHVAARSIATHALSIFGDHSDVMAARAAGWALLSSSSVQEAMDMACIAHMATLQSRLPFIHFFDGFRTSHEINKVEMLSDSDLDALIDEQTVRAHRQRALSPDRPMLRGTAQNPDIFFQGREAANRYYADCPDIVQKAMDRFGARTGRYYSLFEYYGVPDAERVMVLMGSGSETAHQTGDYLNARGEKVGILKVRLYRPFETLRFVQTLPKTVRSLAVLDRTKEPGATGEPLYLDVLAAIQERSAQRVAPWSRLPTVIGGRYGLGSKELTPAMVKAIFDELTKPEPKNHFTIGIEDDVFQTSLPYDSRFSIEPESTKRAIFYGLGSDGTVSANKNSIKIIGESTNRYAQAYFVYDSKKSGSMTISHLRFGADPIHAPYLINQAQFVGCHQPVFLDRYSLLEDIAPAGTFLLNSPYGANEIWNHLPRPVQEQILAKKLRFYVIDAYKVAQDSGIGGRINIVMQVCFFAISDILPREQAMEKIKEGIRYTYSKKGDEIVNMNLAAVDQTLAHLEEVHYPDHLTSDEPMRSPVVVEAPSFVRDVLGTMIANRGDSLPVSRMPVDGTFPTDTARWEKRNLAQEIPVWDPQICIQCNKCVMVCPHAVIRAKVYEPARLTEAPETFKTRDALDRNWQGLRFTLQVAPEDCTGCAICVDVCPVRNKSETRLKAINMMPQAPLREAESKNWDFFERLPDLDRRRIEPHRVNEQQIQRPLFEFSGACAGCGETPYLKLLSQLFGDRALIANATGCSSIYGGNLPTTPWAKNDAGRGPAWANSLFEDNAEFGLGFRLSVDKQRAFALELLQKLAPELGSDLVQAILAAQQVNEADIYEQRERVSILQEKLKDLRRPEARWLAERADLLVKKSVWIVGGDGWAYDIGFGGLDHVLASGKNVNILVLDTEVYSNTGGQKSKATPRGAVAKFAAGGKETSKKDLGLMAMSYESVYVAQVAMGARDEHTLKAFLEAESFDGPSLIIAYSHCIAHGINMTAGMQHQKTAVSTGQWLLYRHDPRRALEGLNPLQLDSKAPTEKIERFHYEENRFKMLAKTRPQEAKKILQQSQQDIDHRWAFYQKLAHEKGTSHDGH